MPSDEKGGVGNGVGSDTDMALFDEASCLKRVRESERGLKDSRQRRSGPF